MWCLLVCIQDLEGWCNLTAFDLAEDSPSPERHQFRLEGSALQELSKGSKGQLIPISPGGITPPSILSHRSRRHIAVSPDTNSSMTPKSTPVKALPFSPSQVGSVVQHMVELVAVVVVCVFGGGAGWQGGAVIPKRESDNLSCYLSSFSICGPSKTLMT